MTKKFSLSLLLLLLVTVFIQPITAVKATELSLSDSIKHSALFLEFKDSNLEISESSYFEDNKIVTTLIDSNGVVLATDIYDLLTHTIIATASSDTQSIIETTDVDGLVSRQFFEKIKTFVPVLRYVYDGWQYTGLAIPSGAVASLGNLAFGALVSGVAGLFGVAVATINSVLAFMGIGWSTGEMLARALDTDGNGWVALYKRARRAYRGGPIVGYGHKTT